MYQHLLVPVEDTDASIQAIGHATEFARTIGARITFLHASPSVTGVTDAPRRQIEGHAGELLARAEAGARAHGVPCTSVIVAGDAPFDTAIAQARRLGCDLICTDADFPATGASMPGADRPAMLSCGTDQRPAVAASIGALLNAQRTLSDTLHDWLDSIRAARDRGAVTHVATMREIVRKLQALPARGVCANEKASLFDRLHKRTRTMNAEIAELERLHRRDEEMLQELARLAEQDSRHAPMPEDLEPVVSAYAQFVWEWMGREQGMILPAARRYLSYADWAEIDGNFSSGKPAGRTAETQYASSESDGPRA